ncbi:MAG: hypothetical protein KJ774_12870 [Firmicutes bacterium]|nr:hypothetical protein [Bacillota bacterium]
MINFEAYNLLNNTSAHRLIGTVTRGTCRIGIGYFNETADIDALVNGLNSYQKENN